MVFNCIRIYCGVLIDKATLQRHAKEMLLENFNDYQGRTNSDRDVANMEFVALSAFHHDHDAVQLVEYERARFGP